MAVKLISHFTLDPSFVGGILDFLTNRLQRVRVNGILSDELLSSTVSCRSLYENRYVKYADNSVVHSSHQ